MQIHCDPHDDPYCRLRLEHLKIWVEIVRRCGVLACTTLAKAWEASWVELQDATHRCGLASNNPGCADGCWLDCGELEFLG